MLKKPENNFVGIKNIFKYIKLKSSKNLCSNVPNDLLFLLDIFQIMQYYILLQLGEYFNDKY